MRQLPALLISIILSYSQVNCQDDDDSAYSVNPVEISSTHMDYENKMIIIRESKRLMISCVFARDDIADLSDLQWKREAGKNIDDNSSPSVFTVAVNEHKTHHKKRNLHFTAIHKRDEGTYVCMGKNLDGKEFTDTIKIVVLETIAWNDVSTQAGGLVGEPLTIDCGTKKGGKEPQIEITNGEGEALDAEKYTIAGNEVTIEELTKDFNGKKISCVHVELVTKGDDIDYPVVDRKDVEIDVWHLPEFDEDEKVQYTIVQNGNRPVTTTLVCNVTESNPPATHYAFFKGNEELKNARKYEMVKMVGRKQGAQLKISNVDEYDLDEYRCEVNNGKAKANQIIHLKEASPPPEPKVTLDKVKKHSLTFKIESVERDGELPVLNVSIQYVRKAIINEQDFADDQDTLSDEVWDKHSTSIMKRKQSNDIYEITGLRQGSEYMFRFRLISEAGAGDAVHLSAFTGDDVRAHDDVSSSRFSAPSAFLVLFLLISLLW